MYGKIKAINPNRPPIDSGLEIMNYGKATCHFNLNLK